MTARKSDRSAVRLPTVGGDWLCDTVAAAEFLGITTVAFESRMQTDARCPASKELFKSYIQAVSPADASLMLTRHPQLQGSFAELLRRAGSRGRPMSLYLLSSLAAWKADRPRRGGV